MKADTLSLINLFNKPVSYIVPLFQRPYVWNRDEHWQPLWEDFRLVVERLIAARVNATEDALERGRPEQHTASHFLGAVVVEQLPTGAGMIEQRTVIDGQQRLTTLQLFLDAAHDVAAEYEDESAKLFAKLTDNDPDLVRGRIDRYKVWPTNIDQLAFRLTMGKDELSEEGLPDVTRTSIWEAHEYFSEALREWLEEDHHASVSSRLDALRTVLWSLVRLVVIDLDSGDNAQVIFETLNARGTPLLASDLIKNSLFQQAAEHHLHIAQLYETGWKPLDAEWWREEITQGRLFRPRLDVFFFHWLTMRRGTEFGVHELFSQFKRYSAEHGNPEGILGDIAHHAKVFRSFDSYPPNTPEETFFYRLRMTETATATPVLLYVVGQPKIEVPPEQKSKLMQAVESWLIRRMLCRLTTKHYNIVFMNLLESVLKEPGQAGDVAINFFSQLGGESQEWPSDGQLREALLSLPLYRIVGRGRLRMVLEALEDALRPGGTVEESHGPRGLTIEHVLPQAWKVHWPLPPGEASVEAEMRRETLKHAIGNLTLVTNKLNPKLSHAPWSEKRETLKDHTVLFLNKDLVNDHPDRWDEGTILERSQQLAELAIKIWPGPTSSDRRAPVPIDRALPVRPVREDQEMPAGVVAIDVDVASQDQAGNSWPHEVIRSRSATPFLQNVVDEIEEWLRSIGVRVQHKRGSNHALYVGKRRIGGYYFAKRWIHFVLRGRDSSDAAFEGLSHPVSLSITDQRVTGNILTPGDLELFKQGVQSRVGS